MKKNEPRRYFTEVLQRARELIKYSAAKAAGPGCDDIGRSYILSIRVALTISSGRGVPELSSGHAISTFKI